MTPAEAQVLLSMAAAFDNRKPDADAARAWAAALDDVPFDDCRAALIEHYKTNTDYLMPVMVRTIVRRKRATRIQAAGVLDVPHGLDPDDTAAYTRYLAGVRRAVADGHEAPVHQIANPAPAPSWFRQLESRKETP